MTLRTLYVCSIALALATLAHAAHAELPEGRPYASIAGAFKADSKDPDGTGLIYTLPVLEVGWRSGGEGAFRWAVHVLGARGPFGNLDDTGGVATEIGIGGDVGVQTSGGLCGVRVDGGYGHYHYDHNYRADRPQLDGVWLEPKAFVVGELTANGDWALRGEAGARARWYSGTLVQDGGKQPPRDAHGLASGTSFAFALERRF